MLNDAFYLLVRDLKYLIRRRETLLWTFVMPVIFFYFIGSATGGFGRSDTPDPLKVTVGANGGFLADELVKRLKERGYRIVPASTPAQETAREMRIPENFTATVLAGRPATVAFVRQGANAGADYDETRLQRAVYTVLADLIAVSDSGDVPSAEAFRKLAQEPRTIALHATAAGKRKDPPVGFAQSVPGILVMFTLLVLFTSGSVSVLVERRQGILRRLASSPMSRGAVVLGKWGARLVLGWIQIAFAMVAGTVLFKVHWGEHLPAILAVLAVYAALAAALGLLLGNFAGSDGQVIGIGVIASNVKAAIGGCWWPIEITPRWTQSLALVLPTGWAMDALHKLMSFGDAPSAVVPHIVAFTLATAAAGYILVRKFRFL